MHALVIVDFQNDFTAGGALPVPGGDTIADRLNALAHDFALVIATRDWHPPNHSSFVENGGPWPVHGVQGTPGAELNPALDRSQVDLVVDKGMDPALDGYSGFAGTRLAEILRERDVVAITVVGLATDYCVKNTALDGLRDGFTVTVDGTATRGVDIAPGDSARALDEVRVAGGDVT